MNSLRERLPLLLTRFFRKRPKEKPPTQREDGSPSPEFQSYPAIGYEIAKELGAFTKLDLTDDDAKMRLARSIETHVFYRLHQEYPALLIQNLRGYNSTSAQLALRAESLSIINDDPHERAIEMAGRSIAYTLTDHFEMTLAISVGSFISTKRGPIILADEDLSQILNPRFTTFQRDLEVARSLGRPQA